MPTTKSKKPTVLVIMDGWGIAPPSKGNAVTLAKTPNLNRLSEKYPHTTLFAHGKYAGLPSHQDGNSEAGHMNIGAGRKVDQDAVIISRSIKDGTFFKNTAFRSAVKHVQKNKSNMHLMGLLSNGDSAHASPDHLDALLKMVRQHDIKNVYLHLFTDGRDSPQYAASRLIKKLEKKLWPNEIISTVMGRYYGMERTKNWPITERAYNALTLGEGDAADSPQQAINRAYNKKETDEFVFPTIVKKNHLAPRFISDNDAVLFFNLRSDRARQITKTFTQEDFNAMNPNSFKRKKTLKNLLFIAMTDFGPDLPRVTTAYPSADLQGTLPMALKDLKQLYITETEKYAHVTYFFNGGYADPVGGEDRIMIKSPRIKSYADKPEMSAQEITNVVIKNIEANVYDFITMNYANPDMVGHTGDLAAGIRACECTDNQIGQLAKLIAKKKGNLFITADHGNVEEMINLETGEVDTKHSTNPVPFIWMRSDEKRKIKLGKSCILGNVAFTVLNVLGIEKTKEMSKECITK